MGVISTRDEDLAKRLRFLQLGQYLINLKIVLYQTRIEMLRSV